MNDKNILFGLHAVEALIEKHPARIIRLALLQDRQDQKIQKLIELAKNKKIKIELLSRQTLDKLTHDANHQGAVAFCEKPKLKEKTSC
jgi:23S rRNA (guanosine2251-2'-O)-methyltransferase